MIAITSEPIRPRAQPGLTPLRCLVCGRPFDFDSGESAIVLRHVAYYYDFVHDRQCLTSALERIFPEPGYDCAAFGCDRERIRVVRARPLDARAPGQRGQVYATTSVESLRYCALIEHADGGCRLEQIVREAELADEPGGAEFPLVSPAIRLECALQPGEYEVARSSAA